MKTKSALAVFFTAMMLLSCCRGSRPANQHQPSSINSDSLDDSFDTLSVLRRLAFSSEDSSVIHFDSTTKNPLVTPDEQVLKVSISKTLPPLYIHSIVSVYPEYPSDESFGCYVILYGNLQTSESVKRIRQDSIEVSEGSLEGFNPAIKLVDVNHDGFKDLIISFLQNTTGKDGENFFWTFDSSIGRFLPDLQLDSMFQDQSIYVGDDGMEISTGDRTGAVSYFGQTFRWTGEKYEIYAEDSTDYAEDGVTVLSFHKELINGEWKTISCDTLSGK